MIYKRLDDELHNALHDRFDVGAEEEHLIPYHLTKDHITLHNSMYPRRGNSCSYPIECHLHGRVIFCKVVCYISHHCG